jgi:hypothetical protein
VSARDGESRFDRFVRAAAKNVFEHVERKFVRREPCDREPEDRRRAHRVDVGDRVRRGDLSEEIWIVDDRREEIDGLRDRGVTRDANHGRVIAGRISDKKIPGPFAGGEFGKDRAQVILTQLARSTAGRREGRKRRVAAQRVLHVCDLIER